MKNKNSVTRFKLQGNFCLDNQLFVHYAITLSIEPLIERNDSCRIVWHRLNTPLLGAALAYNPVGFKLPAVYLYVPLTLKCLNSCYLNPICCIWPSCIRRAFMLSVLKFSGLELSGLKLYYLKLSGLKLFTLYYTSKLQKWPDYLKITFFIFAPNDSTFWVFDSIEIGFLTWLHLNWLPDHIYLPARISAACTWRS